MIEVEVNFLSYFRRFTNEGKIVVSVPEKSFVRDLIALLVRRYGVGFRDFLLDHEHRLQQYVVILVNGRGIGILEGLDTLLHNGDSISMMPAVGGG